MTWTKKKDFKLCWWWIQSIYCLNSKNYSLWFNFLFRSCLSILCQFTNLKEKIIPIHQFQLKNWKNKIQFYCFIDNLYFVPLPQWVQQDRSSRFWVVLPRSPHRKYLWIVLANLLGAIFLHQPIFLCKKHKITIRQMIHGILLPKLFWPTVRRNLVIEKNLKVEAEVREFAKILRSLE